MRKQVTVLVTLCLFVLCLVMYGKAQTSANEVGNTSTSKIVSEEPKQSKVENIEITEEVKLPVLTAGVTTILESTQYTASSEIKEPTTKTTEECGCVFVPTDDIKGITTGVSVIADPDVDEEEYTYELFKDIPTQDLDYEYFKICYENDLLPFYKGNANPNAYVRKVDFAYALWKIANPTNYVRNTNIYLADVQDVPENDMFYWYVDITGGADLELFDGYLYFGDEKQVVTDDLAMYAEMCFEQSFIEATGSAPFVMIGDDGTFPLTKRDVVLIIANLYIRFNGAEQTYVYPEYAEVIQRQMAGEKY